MNEYEKYEYWNKKGIKRGITYSVEELILKHKRNKMAIRFGFLGIVAVIGFLIWIIYFWEISLLRLL